METDSNLYFTILESELIDTIIQIDFSDFLKKNITCQSIA